MLLASIKRFTIKLVKCGTCLLLFLNMKRHSFNGRLYAFYAWCAGGLFVLIAGIGIVLLPALRWRRAAARRTARGLLRLAGMSLSVSGLEKVPEGGCIIIANHASYLDGIVLTAALPPRFGFVIKREMTRIPLVSTLLHRLGSQFMERNNPSTSRADASRLLRSATNGTALGIFPEGTFTGTPGIAPFRLGAFRTACRGNIPLITCGIRGTRHILPSGTWHPLPGTISVAIGESFSPQDKSREEAQRLLHKARVEIGRLANEELQG